jgi:hypothetical protein
MGNIANRILGMTDAKILELETPRVHSSDQVSLYGQTSRNVRINAGLVVFSDDIDKEREKLRKNSKRFLSKLREEAQGRIKEREERRSKP